MNKLPIIKRGSHGGIDFDSNSKTHSQMFLYVYFAFLFIFFIVLVFKLFHLTVVKGVYYRNLSDDNRIKEVVIEPKRGKIIDRNGAILAENVEADVNQKSDRLNSIRRYNDPEAFAHLIGYRQTADKNDMASDPCINKLKLGDKTGKKGAEKYFDCDLRGEYGKKLIELDARGKFINTIAVVPEVDGRTVQLAVDATVQKKGYDLVKASRAVMIALEPKTGEVISMVSTPSYNPQSFENGDGNLINQYFADKEKPMFNRALEGTYPPGSTFKLVVASVAMEEKKIDEKTIVEDTGFIQAGPIRFGNWYYLQYGKKEGSVDLFKALQRSNDIYFYKIGEMVGPEKIKEWADKFGYEKKSGLGLDEAEGMIPSPFWKADILKENWYTGDTYNFSIGQGYLLTTPMQVARMTSVFANNGYLCKPQLLKSTSSEMDKSNCIKVPISQKTIDDIRQGMKEACSTGGTGWPFFNYRVPLPGVTDDDLKKLSSTEAALKTRPIQVGCKTGTAESHALSGMSHAWFTVFAPYDNPEIVLTVLIEEGGQGSDVAGPIAKDVLKEYFRGRE
jgi:penicillin-binding protein 2